MQARMQITASKVQPKVARQQGSIVIGAILVIILLGFVMLGIYKYQQWQHKKAMAQSLGNQIAMVVNAIEQRASFDSHLADGAYHINALLANTCHGLANKAYLPCGFRWNTDLLGGVPVFTITHDAHHPEIVNARLVVGPIGLEEAGLFHAIPFLAGAVMAAAQAKVINTSGKFLSAAVSYQSNLAHSSVIAGIAANQNNANIYLRVDGSNDMQGGIHFAAITPAANRLIQNVAHINSTDLNIQANSLALDTTGGNVLLGNQSGALGTSNVTVNDLTIHSMGDQKLTSLLGKGNISSDFKSDGRSNLDVTGTSGPTGKLFVNVYCSAWQYWDKAIVRLRLFKDGAQIAMASGWVMEFDGTSHHSSAQPQLTWIFSGLPRNTLISGIKITCTGENGGVHDIGYWTLGV